MITYWLLITMVLSGNSSLTPEIHELVFSERLDCFVHGRRLSEKNEQTVFFKCEEWSTVYQK